MIVREIALRSGTTWYRALGDVPFMFATAGVLGMSWFFTIRRQRRLAPATVPDRRVVTGT